MSKFGVFEPGGADVWFNTSVDPKKKNQMYCSNECKPNPSIFKKGRKLSQEQIKKCLRRNPISSLEKKFLEIINKHNLPYKFVGNGDFLIGRKCPDFININGQKIAIEVYYRGHKEFFKGGLQKWMEERQNIFNSFGWQIKFFDETEVKEELILKTLTEVY